jgi:hypothetical protein
MTHTELPDTVKQTIVSPSRVFSRAEVLTKSSVVPKRPGLYGWYFREIPPSVPTDGCVTVDDLTLLYVGISPKKPPLRGKPSKQNLAKRVRYHMKGNAEGSTLRLTLGCLLSDSLGIELRRVGRGKRLTFHSGEAALSEWLERNAYVVWVVHPEPWVPEDHLIHTLSLPLNLDHNEAHPFHPTLSAIRKEAKLRAKSLPVAES